MMCSNILPLSLVRKLSVVGYKELSIKDRISFEKLGSGSDQRFSSN